MRFDNPILKHRFTKPIDIASFKEVKKVLIKEQEKTQYGPPIFGKVLADKAPNGTSRAPKFNYKSIEDQ